MKAKSATACIVFLVLFIFTPKAFASTSITVSNNGSGSTNTVTVNNSSTTSYNQSNSGFISNFIKVITNTGGNSSSNNTGSNSKVNSGDASSEVNIQNNLNSNYAETNNCCTAVPEFGMIPGAIALASSGATYFYLKKRNFNKK